MNQKEIAKAYKNNPKGRYVLGLDKFVLQEELKETIRYDPGLVMEFTARCAIRKWGRPKCEHWSEHNQCCIYENCMELCGIDACAEICPKLNDGDK